MESTTKVKVFVVTTVHGRYDIRIFLKQCRSLVTHGNDVTLVVQDGKGNESRDGVKILDLGDPPAGRIRRIFFSPWRAYRFLKSVSSDIVHFHDPELLPVGLLLKLNNRTVVYDSHEDVPRQILSKHWILSGLRKTIAFSFEVFEDFVTKRLDAVVCATPLITNRFSKINRLNINVNNYPIIEEFMQFDGVINPSFGNTICYVGAITRERGVLELLAAMDILKNVTLIMCGSFESSAFEAELKSLSGWKYVDYRGVVGRGEIVKVFAVSSLGIVTLLETPNQIEALPIKMFEYMAAGLPFVASDFPLWRGIVAESQCGVCVDPSSPSEIAKAIAHLLSDEALCREMGNAGRKAVMSKYNWSNEAEKLFSVYRSIKPMKH